MQFLRAIERPNLSEDVASALREMIVDGRLAAGDRVNEVHLAARLAVSRTPLREALARLAAEGALDAVPRSGYFVRPLTLEELRDVYPMRALLDPEALRLAGIPSGRRLARLEALNRRIEEASEPDDVIRLDDEWHRELVAGCPNRVLLELIEAFKRRTRRYELALMREKANVERSAGDHEGILEALRAGRLARACAALRKNMESGLAPLEAWLIERGGE